MAGFEESAKLDCPMDCPVLDCPIDTYKGDFASGLKYTGAINRDAESTVLEFNPSSPDTTSLTPRLISPSNPFACTQILRHTCFHPSSASMRRSFLAGDFTSIARHLFVILYQVDFG
ncbi:hypothetical protein BLNAU_21123 [Blattamonas nauphoetae]|uniref:Uncharacterized protein n=1 Tax=Blattamonas nauphoetae TaxID=2049346 RepID=A0ABQ9WZ20_9EUKA|nr:hypothetical protein BLNAU_21123 [Blattamonas nauphoetae]